LILTALAFVCCTAIAADSPGNVATPSSEELKSPTAMASAEEMKSVKPDAPKAKILTSGNEESALGSSAEPASSSSSSEPLLRTPIKPATGESYETPRQRKIWYGLMAAGHGAAAFDAWTTRRAISGGYGVEANPLERPFANSGAIYVTTQLCPALMDYVGRRMMRSGHPWMRRVWWVPQTASASFSLGAGIHNYGIVH